MSFKTKQKGKQIFLWYNIPIKITVNWFFWQLKMSLLTNVLCWRHKLRKQIFGFSGHLIIKWSVLLPNHGSQQSIFRSRINYFVTMLCRRCKKSKKKCICFCTTSHGILRNRFALREFIFKVYHFPRLKNWNICYRNYLL